MYIYIGNHPQSSELTKSYFSEGWLNDPTTNQTFLCDDHLWPSPDVDVCKALLTLPGVVQELETVMDAKKGEAPWP